MSVGELCRFGLWRLITVLFGKDFYEMPPLCKVLTAAGKLLFLLGIAVFSLGWLFTGARKIHSYDYTIRLDEPQLIVSGNRLLAANDRIYVFSRELCAVNVYKEDEEFLFCVRGPQDKNARNEMFLSGTDIYIDSSKGGLLRFDENGTYLGRAVGRSVYDSYDQPVISLDAPEGAKDIPAVYFDDNGLWCCARYEDGGRVLLYSDGTGTEEIGPAKWDRRMQTVKMEGCVYAENRYARTDGGVLYSVRANQILRITDSSTSVFVESSLYQYFLVNAPFFGFQGWAMAIIGEAFVSLAKKLYIRKKGGTAA